MEKDYYVTLLLEELSEKQEEVPAYFKSRICLKQENCFLKCWGTKDWKKHVEPEVI